MAQQFKATISEFEADDIRAFYDSVVLRVWHLGGKPRTFKIAQKPQQIVTEFRNETRTRAVLTLVDRDGVVQLPFELNPTNRKTISQLYGTKPSAWTGKFITLYPTTTEMAGQTVDCIRVRPSVPGTEKGGDAKTAKPRTNKQGATVLQPKAEPAAVDAAPSPEPESAREPGDDAEDAPDSEPPPGVLTTDTAQSNNEFGA